MKEQSIAAIRQTIENWKAAKRYTYHQKELIVAGKSPIVDGETVLRFKNSLKSFFCQGKLIPVEYTSKLFHTTTLSDHPISINPNADEYKLKAFLEKFDDEFDDLVDRELSNCPDSLTTSDPLFF